MVFWETGKGTRYSISYIVLSTFLSERYTGIADADETAVAAGLALQAYFEGRAITKDDMDKCIEYWKENVSEMSDPVGRKREVCW